MSAKFVSKNLCTHWVYRCCTERAHAVNQVVGAHDAQNTGLDCALKGRPVELHLRLLVDDRAGAVAIPSSLRGGGAREVSAEPQCALLVVIDLQRQRESAPETDRETERRQRQRERARPRQTETQKKAAVPVSANGQCGETAKQRSE
eukprot:COSAG03_NODE_3131_length_2191_cov_1639.706501_1_plen_147_part_00